MVEVQALIGDSTDNVPGAPGIGPKTAAQLIEEYGDLDTLLARAHEIKQPRRRETLIEFADQIRLSRRLVTLDCEAPAPEPISDFAVRDPDPEALAAFLDKMEFRSLRARVGDGKAPATNGTAFVARPKAPPAPPGAPVATPRYGQVVDPFGHNWSIATHVKDMTQEEMMAAMNEMQPDQANCGPQS